MPQSSCSREMRWALFFVGLASGPPPSALQLPLCACWPGAASWFEGIHCPPLPPDLLPGTVVRSRHAWLERSLHCLLLLQIDIRVCQLHPFHNFALHLNTCGRFRSVFHTLQIEIRVYQLRDPRFFRFPIQVRSRV